jgi:protein-S-isoprenylcysteine O-methyltransferase Ste14
VTCGLSTILLLASNLGSHALFVWGRYNVFRIGDRTPRGVRLIEVSAIICILSGVRLTLRRAGPQLGFDILAILLAVTSAGLFVWGVATVHQGRLSAAFSHEAATEVIIAGPFRYVRHPFYLSYLLAYVQAVLASRSGWAIIPLLWMTGIYGWAALSEERSFHEGPLAATYLSYAAHTARFIPTRTPKRRR